MRAADFDLGLRFGRAAARFFATGRAGRRGFGFPGRMDFLVDAGFAPAVVAGRGAGLGSTAGAAVAAGVGRRSGGSVWICRSRSSRLRRSASWSHSRSFCSSVAGAGAAGAEWPGPF